MVVLGILVALVVIAIIGLRQMEDWGIAATIVLTVLLYVLVVCISCSYETSLNAKATYETIALAHPQAIEYYQEKVILYESSLTDFKYQGYQESLSSMIKDLRDTINKYNKIVIKKRMLKKNSFFGLFTHHFKELPLIEFRTQFKPAIE